MPGGSARRSSRRSSTSPPTAPGGETAPRRPARPPPSAGRTARRSSAATPTPAPRAAELVLAPSFGRQAIVIPPHRVEDHLARHPLEPGDHIGMRVGHDVTDVDVTADGGWWRVEGVDLLARLRPVEPIGSRGLPPLAPGCFQSLDAGLFRHGHARSLRHARARAPAIPSPPWRFVRSAAPTSPVALASVRTAGPRWRRDS